MLPIVDADCCEPNTGCYLMHDFYHYSACLLSPSLELQAHIDVSEPLINAIFYLAQHFAWINHNRSR